MGFTIDDPDTLRLARRVADLKGLDLAGAVRLALRHELERAEEPGLAEQTERFLRDLDARTDWTKGLPANKAFNDDLSGGI